MPYRQNKERKNSLFPLSPNFTYAFTRTRFFVLMLWTAFFWLGIATSDLLL
jgi:hypothetical protein